MTAGASAWFRRLRFATDFSDYLGQGRDSARLLVELRAAAERAVRDSAAGAGRKQRTAVTATGSRRRETIGGMNTAAEPADISQARTG